MNTILLIIIALVMLVMALTNFRMVSVFKGMLKHHKKLQP
jgi:hypothetical protein